MNEQPADRMQHYFPNRLHTLGLRGYAEMARSLFEARELLWRLIWRDLLLRVKVSFLGLFWSVAQPLALMLIFVFLRDSGVVRCGETSIPYPVFAYTGVLGWNLFTSMLSNASGSLLGAANLVAKLNFPREVLVLSACARAVFDALFGLPVLVILCLWVGATPAWTAVFAPLVLLPVLLLGVGLGLILAMVALPVRDITHALPLVMAPLMFITPVFYELPANGPLAWVAVLNPMDAFMHAFRDLLFVGALRGSVPFAAATLEAALILALGWRLFRFAMPRIPEYA